MAHQVSDLWEGSSGLRPGQRSSDTRTEKTFPKRPLHSSSKSLSLSSSSNWILFLKIWAHLSSLLLSIKFSSFAHFSSFISSFPFLLLLGLCRKPIQFWIYLMHSSSESHTLPILTLKEKMRKRRKIRITQSLPSFSSLLFRYNFTYFMVTISSLTPPTFSLFLSFTFFLLSSTS